MKRLVVSMAVVCLVRTVCFACPWGQRPDETNAYAVHDDFRPMPPKVSVPMSTGVPSDAIVLWRGTEFCLTNWCDSAGRPTKWTCTNGGDFVSVQGAGYVCTRERFEDIQLHVEFATELDEANRRKGSGNSGVFLPGGYEVQVLDSFDEPERERGMIEANYPDGSCGAIYGQNPPAVNPCRRQTEWQSFDIVFHPPLVRDGKVARKATMTVFFNGVLVQDHWMCNGPTNWLRRDTPIGGTDGPVMLQDHGHPVHYRNIWVRRIRPREANVLSGEFADRDAVAAKRRELAEQADRAYEKWASEMPLREKLFRAWAPAAYSPTPERIARARTVEAEFLSDNQGRSIRDYCFDHFYPSLLKIGLIDETNAVLKLMDWGKPAHD